MFRDTKNDSRHFPPYTALETLPPLLCSLKRQAPPSTPPAWVKYGLKEPYTTCLSTPNGLGTILEKIIFDHNFGSTGDPRSSTLACALCIKGVDCAEIACK